MISHDKDEATSDIIWEIRYDDGEHEDCNARELQHIIIPENDQLERAIRNTKSPQLLIGKKMARYFGENVHDGIIVNHDEDEKNDDIIWRVIYEDKDEADYDINEINEGLELYENMQREKKKMMLMPIIM